MCYCCDFLQLFIRPTVADPYFMLLLNYFNAGRNMFQYVS